MYHADVQNWWFILGTQNDRLRSAWSFGYWLDVVLTFKRQCASRTTYIEWSACAPRFRCKTDSSTGPLVFLGSTFPGALALWLTPIFVSRSSFCVTLFVCSPFLSREFRSVVEVTFFVCSTQRRAFCFLTKSGRVRNTKEAHNSTTPGLKQLAKGYKT